MPNTYQSNIEVAIYNLTGQLIKVLDNANGDNDVKTFWDGTDSRGHRVAPGIYLIVGRSMDMFQTKTILFK